MHCNALQCNAMQRNAMQCNAMQRNAMQSNAMERDKSTVITVHVVPYCILPMSSDTRHIIAPRGQVERHGVLLPAAGVREDGVAHPEDRASSPFNSAEREEPPRLMTTTTMMMMMMTTMMTMMVMMLQVLLEGAPSGIEPSEVRREK